jgi:hypothetical protein
LVALPCLGCRTVSLDGAWHGGVPLEGSKDCRARLKPDGAFDLTCGGQPGYAGQGRWRLSGETLHMRFTSLVTAGALVKPPLPSWDFTVQPNGNRCTLVLEGTQRSFEWTRGQP